MLTTRTIHRALLLLLCLLLMPILAFAGEKKAYHLSNGEVVVGEVIDETPTGYLIRTVEDKTVKVKYGDIEKVVPLEPGAPTAAPAPSGPPSTVSDDGFRFPSTGARRQYERERLVVEVMDLSRGVWTSVATSRSSSTSAGLGGLVSTGIEAVTGARVDVDLDKSSGRTVESARGTYEETVERRYRIATGEGVALTEVVGDVLQDPETFFEFIDMMEAYETHGQMIGDLSEADFKRIRAGHTVVGLSLVGGGSALMGAGGGVLSSGSDEELGFTLLFAGLGTALSSYVAFVTGPKRPTNSAVALGLARDRLQRFELTPWSIQEALPFIHGWNDTVLEDAGGQ